MRGQVCTPGLASRPPSCCVLRGCWPPRPSSPGSRGQRGSSVRPWPCPGPWQPRQPGSAGGAHGAEGRNWPRCPGPARGSSPLSGSWCRGGGAEGAGTVWGCLEKWSFFPCQQAGLPSPPLLLLLLLSRHRSCPSGPACSLQPRCSLQSFPLEHPRQMPLAGSHPSPASSLMKTLSTAAATSSLRSSSPPFTAPSRGGDSPVVPPSSLWGCDGPHSGDERRSDLLAPTAGRACPSWGQGHPRSQHPDPAPPLQPGALWLVPARGRARCFVWMAQHFG